MQLSFCHLINDSNIAKRFKDQKPSNFKSPCLLFHSKRTLVVQVNFLPWTLQIDTAEKKNRGFKVPIPECTTVHTSLVLIIRSSLDFCQYKRA